MFIWSKRGMQKIAVYVISLARATERRKSITTHLDEIGIEYELVDGVDGRSLTDAYRASVVAPGCDLTPGMIGCNLSHWEVSKRHLASGCAVALILEDDARLNPAVAAFIRNGVNPSAFDFCFLDCADWNWQLPVFYDPDDGFVLDGAFRAHRLSSGPVRAHALLVTLDATAKRLPHMVPIRHCIDTYSSLPYAPRFYAITAPKAAWLSDHSYRSFTSPSGTNGELPPARSTKWRHSAIRYRLKDWLKLKYPRRRLLARLLRSEGFLSPGRRWVPLPPAGKVMSGSGAQG